MNMINTQLIYFKMMSKTHDNRPGVGLIHKGEWRFEHVPKNKF